MLKLSSSTPYATAMPSAQSDSCRQQTKPTRSSNSCWTNRLRAIAWRNAEPCSAAAEAKGTPPAFIRYLTNAPDGAGRLTMTAETLIIWIIVGAVAGWLAGLVVRGFGFGLLGNIIVGILGAVLGGWLFGAIGFSFFPGILNAIITAFLGAVILLFVVRLIKRA